MEEVRLETLKSRMEDLGLSFMAAGFDSYLEEQSRNDNTLLERIYDLVETEFIPRKERAKNTAKDFAHNPFLSLRFLQHFI